MSTARPCRPLLPVKQPFLLPCMFINISIRVVMISMLKAFTVETISVSRASCMQSSKCHLSLWVEMQTALSCLIGTGNVDTSNSYVPTDIFRGISGSQLPVPICRCSCRRSDLFRIYMRFRRCEAAPDEVDTNTAHSKDKTLYLSLQRCWEVSHPL